LAVGRKGQERRCVCAVRSRNACFPDDDMASIEARENDLIVLTW
jgi:hypothetical protein